jgi:hypothetical protein
VPGWGRVSNPRSTSSCTALAAEAGSFSPVRSRPCPHSLMANPLLAFGAVLIINS